MFIFWYQPMFSNPKQLMRYSAVYAAGPYQAVLPGGLIYAEEAKLCGICSLLVNIFQIEGGGSKLSPSVTSVHVVWELFTKCCVAQQLTFTTACKFWALP